MKTLFKNFCKENKMKFEGIKNDNFIASQLVPKYYFKISGGKLKKELASKTRHFFVFDNLSGCDFDFSQIFSYREQLEQI